MGGWERDKENMFGLDRNYLSTILAHSLRLPNTVPRDSKPFDEKEVYERFCKFVNSSASDIMFSRFDGMYIPLFP